MQIEKHEYLAVTAGLTAQVGIMARLAKERRVTIEALKQELQYRDNIITEIRKNSQVAIDAMNAALQDTMREAREAQDKQEEAWDYITHVLRGTATIGPREGDPLLYSLAWKVRGMLDRAQARGKKCRACKGRACCK